MFYTTGETSLTIYWHYCQKPYLEPNQKSMVELFAKNS